jgi:hypothetical protein
MQPADVLHAIDRGIDFLNWCGASDALSAAVAGLGRVCRHGGSFP